MSTNSSRISQPLQQFDHGLERVINHGGTVIDTVTSPLIWVIKTIQNLEIGRSQDFESPTSGIAEKTLKFLGAFRTCYYGILQAGDKWANQVGKDVERISRVIFTPITFCRTGEALQKNISEKIVARLAYAVAFCVFQIFQAVPYLVIATIGVGINVMYNTAPVALMSSLLGSVLFLQTYFLLYLGREVHKVNQVANQWVPEKIGKNFLTFLASLPIAAVKLPIIALKGVVSYIPIGSAASTTSQR